MDLTHKTKKLINYRPLFEIALAMMAGVSACTSISPNAAKYLYLALTVCGIVLLTIRKQRAAIIILAATIGFTLASIMLPAQFNEGEANISGSVCAVSKKKNKLVLYLKHADIDGKAFNKRIKLETPLNKSVNIGDRIQAQANVWIPNGRAGTYDEYKYCLSIGVGAAASCDTLTVTQVNTLPYDRFASKLRSAAENRIERIFGKDAEIFKAVFIGDKAELSEERYEPYKTMGIAHLLAVSGFHVGVIAGGVIALIPKTKKKPRFFIAAAILTLYCILVGFTPSIVRASIMLCALLLADLFERRHDTLSALSLAAVLIMAVNPFSVYSIGFQLSFSAVFGIALFVRSIQDTLVKLRINGRLASAIAVSLSAMIGTFAFQIRYFSTMSPYALIVNIIAVPLFSIMVVSGMSALLVSIVSLKAAELFAVLPRGLLFAVERVLNGMSRLPAASIEFNGFPMACCIVYLIALLFSSEYLLRSRTTRLGAAAFWFSVFTLLLVASIIIV